MIQIEFAKKELNFKKNRHFKEEKQWEGTGTKVPIIYICTSNDHDNTIGRHVKISYKIILSCKVWDRIIKHAQGSSKQAEGKKHL